jgi:hypothetical protein
VPRRRTRQRLLGLLAIVALLATSGIATASPRDGAPPDRERGRPDHAGEAGRPPHDGEADPSTWPVQPSSRVPMPEVSGPVTGGIRTGEPYGATLIALAEGWVEEEFFVAGSARAPGADDADYVTRILVRRPTDPAEFNGTIVLDWVNVTIPDDTDVSWPPMAHTIMERGFVYVAVSAQRLGVEGSPLALKQWDPVRYGTLRHPGDEYSFDIFSQAAEAILAPAVLGDLRPRLERRLALGASQSAGRLKAYINDHQRDAGVLDGFMPQISGPGGLDRAIAPVLWLNSQDEISSGGVAADSELFRLWEVAGPAHTTNEYHAYVNATYAHSHSGGLANPYDPEDAGAWGYRSQYGRCLTYNYFTVAYAWSAALVALDDWVRTGQAPPPMPRAERSEGALQFDEHGNLRGGIRSPLLDVPIATYYAGSTAPPGAGPDACAQIGSRMPLTGLTRVFTEEQLTELYPTSEDYLTRFEESVADAVQAGFVLPEGARELRRRVLDAAAFVGAATD